MEPIAIIGIGCRFPGAKDPEAFWHLLQNGVDAISEVPKTRWDIDAFYDPKPGTPGKMSTRWGGFLEQVDQFDPGFFGISPREVERMDPQQRLALEVTWEALENAGIAPESLGGSQTGVFMGIGNYDYCRLLTQDISLVNAYDGTGNTLSITANRLSYLLNLRGPSAVIETACSSSLVALHFACHSLQRGESNLCLVGGVSLMLSPEPFITYSHAHMMAADGRCKTFDASADGYVRGEGCGVVVLKRLSDAIRDQDNILAVIKGTAVNQDGLSNGLTAPNGPSQQAVIRQALQNAGVTSDQISYVEAHGTGTSLGDPIEFKSLKAVLMQNRQPEQPCWIGSVKTNIGHLEAASGLVGVIKVALALQHQKIPPHLHLKQLNPYISLADTTFQIPNTCQDWTPGSDRRLAGVSAFGFGGTNCHVILEEAPSNPQPIASDRPAHLLTLSAKSEAALRELAQRYADYLAAHPEVSLADICFTTNTGRSHFDCRLAVVATSHEQLRAQLEAFATGQETTSLVSGQASSKKRSKVAFLFTGQGSQYVNMGRQLYETQPVFRAALDRCAEILRSHLDQPLLEVLYPDLSSDSSHRPETNQSTNSGQTLLDQTAYTQPALFALEYALCQLWKSWGVEPAIVMGHSVGEYVAACVAGVFSLEDGLKLIAERARLMQALPPDGAMVAVFAREDQVQSAIQPYTQEVAIAAINGPQSVVISGQRTAVEAVITSLQNQGYKTKPLNVSHAFHSPLMEPMLEAFEQAAATVQFSSPRVKLISNVSGAIATDEIATPTYWRDHVRQPVRFAQSIQTLQQQGYGIWVEVGPKPTLLGMSRYCLSEEDAQTYALLPSLYPGRTDWQQILHSLAALYVRGVAVNWKALDPGYGRRVQLPTYPFQRQRYWVEFPNQEQAQPASSTHQQAETPVIQWLNQGETQQLAQHLANATAFSADELKLLPKLLDLLVQQNRQQLTAATVKLSLQEWLYQIEWQPQPREAKPSATQNGFHQPGTWLILADSQGVGQAIAQSLNQQGHECLLVYAKGTHSGKVQDSSTIDPSQPEEFDRLFESIITQRDRPLKGILHLWSLDAAPTAELTLSGLEQAQQLGVGSVLHLLKSFGKAQHLHPAGEKANGSKAALPRLWLITQGAMSVGSTVPAVAQTPLWGFGKVVALEHPELWGGMVDLAPEVNEDAIAAFVGEIEGTAAEDHVAFRDGQRYVARLVRQDLPSSTGANIRPDSTYLITGGLGALGIKVAQWLVEQGARHLVLVSRHGASDSLKQPLNQLEQAGAKVVIAKADVSNADDMQGVINSISSSMPPLRGVVHAAGVPGYVALPEMDWNTLESVLRPKLAGTWILHQLTQEISLDFFINFSSIASVWGSKGQAHYAAANQFLDGLAHYRYQQGLPALSINWGPWAGGGMAIDEFQMWMSKMGVEALPPEQAIAALGYLLGTNQIQATVANVDWASFKGIFEARGKRPILSGLGKSDQSAKTPISPAEPAQKSQILQQLEAVTGNERRALLTHHLQTEAAKVLRLEQQPDLEQSLFDLGMDSLMAVELVGLLRSQLQVELPIADFMQATDITSLTSLLLRQLSPADSFDLPTTIATKGLNLQDEAVLAENIHPTNATDEPRDKNTILLTGASGFLGAFLLHELLKQTSADIYCLVRAADVNAAKRKIQQNLSAYDLWQEPQSHRIMPLVGDLSQPRLGLSLEQFDQLADQIDVIYHNAAVLNFVYPYSALKPTNVLGTQEVLRLACQKRIKPFHYVSTDAVFDSSAYYGREVTEAEPILHTKSIDLGYTQTKWVSEKLVTIARDRGLPVTIYRPPLIAGDSRTGIWNTDDFTCRFLKGCIQMGSMPDMNCAITLVPVDYVSQSVVYLSRQPASVGKAFHLNNPHYSSWDEVARSINEFGYPVQQLPYEDWEAQLIETVGAQDNALNGLLPFFLRRWSDEQLTFAGLGQRRVKLNCQATVAQLVDSAIACPRVDAQLLDTYFSYFIQSQFLDAPKVRA